jgi:hypothetical protein
MKVIKDNYNVLPKEVTCKLCKSIVLLETKDDVLPASLPDIYEWTCPCCGFKSVVKICNSLYFE